MKRHKILWTAFRRRRALVWGALAAVVIAGGIMLPALTARPFEPYPACAQVLDRNGNLMRIRLGRDDLDCRPIPLDESGSWTAKALIAAEDKRFLRHPGIDPIAIVRSAVLNTVCGRVVSGASTLTTQTIKLNEPRPRTFRTKIVEAIGALCLERTLSKPAILEQYLNRAPFGGNLAGIESSSLRYFGKHARDLSLAEAALLVGLPKSPARLRPDRHLKKARERQRLVLDLMVRCGFITSDQRDRAAKQPLALKLGGAAFLAPHFCDMVLQRVRDNRTLVTTLDPVCQKAAEDTIRHSRAPLAAQGIHGCAVVILEVRTGAIRALVGAPDFSDTAHEGQVNVAIAPRSPGSALKPFIYALALDEGLCTPESIVGDVPLRFPSYEPSNFNLDFAGPVTIRDALVRSLNIPALNLANRIGQPRVVAQLRKLGLNTLDKPAEYYGLGIALGGGEVTLLDLANAYACLARMGEYRPYRWLVDANPGPVPEDFLRLFSPEAAWLVADMLSAHERGGSGQGPISGAAGPMVAWKTGTSTGFKDAWTFVFNPEYVVGVWVGNPDGTPAPSLIGGEAAAPIAHAIFRSLYPRGGAPWFEPPADLATRDVCAVSGQCPGPHCPACLEDYFIPGVSEANLCSVHRSEPVAGVAAETWPPEIDSFLRGHGMQRAHAPGAGANSGRLRIVSPAGGETFLQVGGLDTIRQDLPLSAVVPSDSDRLFWLVNGRLVAESKPGQTSFWPLRKGEWLITCSDSRGRTDSAKITVR